VSGSYAAFAHRDFRLFQAARFAAAVAIQMQSTVVGAQVYERTGRSLDLGWVGLTLFAPAALLSLVTGHVSDRFDRRRVLMLCHALLALAAFALLVIARSDVLGVGPIFVVLVFVGTARAFLGPANQSLIAYLVPPADLPNAVAWSSSIAQVAMALGPALGGLLYEVAGVPDVAYGTCASLSLLALLFVSQLRAYPVRSERRGVSLETLFAGVRYVWSNKVLLGAISLDLFAVLLGGATALIPAFAKDILDVDKIGFGILRCAHAVGAIVMAVFLAHRPVRSHAGRTMFLCVALFGIATIVFGVSKSYPLSVAALLVVGAADMVSVYVRQTLIQLTTPDAMRGRVAAVNLVFIGASNELGEFESGVTAEWLGKTTAVVAGGVGTLLVVAVWAAIFPALRRVDRLTK
jgi:MFS family permease